jgi:heme/copper-type cytochrome/quinol oxidase subunit 1
MASIVEPAPRSPADVDALAHRLDSLLRPLCRTVRPLHDFFAAVDHEQIGLRYLVTALALLSMGGLEALLTRLELSRPEARLPSPEAYNQVLSLHGLTMMVWYASPVLAGFSSYLVPLLLGARDMAFPRLNAFGYWIFLLSGLFLYAGVLFGLAQGGGLGSVGLASTPFTPGLSNDFSALALVFLTVSTTVGAINLVATILRLRAPGMPVGRMPPLLYSMGATSVLSVLALPALTAACVVLELDRQWGTHFYDAARGAGPVLWPHLFLFFGHSWFYIVLLPAAGMMSMLVPVLARRTLVGCTVVAWSTTLTAVVGMATWVHHMFAVGMTHMPMSSFDAASVTISVFGTIQVFAWLATLWRGRPVWTASLFFALGFIATLVAGGLSAIVTAVAPFEWRASDTYSVAAHLQYVLSGATLFAALAALYYWFPRMAGRMLGERAGRWSFWAVFVGFNLGFFPLRVTGNGLTIVGALVMAFGLGLTLWNIGRSRRMGLVAGANPWCTDTLEWAISSPPPWRRSRAAGRMPEDSILPAVAAVIVAGLVTTFLLKSLWVATAGLALFIAGGGIRP